MNIVRILALVVAVSLFALSAGLAGCEKKSEAPAKPAAGTAGTHKSDGHDHKDGDGHDHKDGDDHDHKEGDGHDHAKPAAGMPAGKAGDDHAGHDDQGHGAGGAMGTATIGAWTVSVSGEVKAGSEAHLDIELSGNAAEPAAVRVWIGSQDGKGSMKQKADGGGSEFHAHTDVPNPIPEDARLWIEIDDGKGGKSVGEFAIKK